MKKLCFVISLLMFGSVCKASDEFEHSQPGDYPRHTAQAAINHLEREGEAEHCDFSGLDLRHLDMSYRDVGGSNFTGAYLPQDCSAAIFNFANLTDVRAQGVNFDGSSLVCANLTRAELQGSSMRSVVLEAANLLDADCTGANFDHTRLARARLTRTNFSGASLHRVALYRATYQEAYLDNAQRFNQRSFESTGLSECSSPNGSSRSSSPSSLFGRDNGMDFDSNDGMDLE